MPPGPGCSDPKHERDSVGSLKRHRQDTGAGYRSGAQTHRGTRTHGQTKKKMKWGPSWGEAPVCPSVPALSGPPPALPETPPTSHSRCSQGPAQPTGTNPGTAAGHHGDALPRPSPLPAHPIPAGRGAGRGAGMGRGERGLIPLLITHQLHVAVLISGGVVPSAYNASGAERLEVPARCQRLAPPRRLRDEATPRPPAPCPLPCSPKAPPPPPHPKKPLWGVSSRLSPRHPALGWSPPPLPCPQAVFATADQFGNVQHVCCGESPR